METISIVLAIMGLIFAVNGLGETIRKSACAIIDAIYENKKEKP